MYFNKFTKNRFLHNIKYEFLYQEKKIVLEYNNFISRGSHF